MTRLIALAPLVLLAGCGRVPETRNFPSQLDGGIFNGNAMSGTVGILTDRETGCQYLVVGYTNPTATPRMDATGKPMCSQPAKPGPA